MRGSIYNQLDSHWPCWKTKVFWDLDLNALSSCAVKILVTGFISLQEALTAKHTGLPKAYSDAYKDAWHSELYGT